MSTPEPPAVTLPYPEELRTQVKCAFCLNDAPTNQVPAGTDNTAYLCDDCNKDMASQRKYPKFGHVIDTQKKTVIQVELPEDVVSPPVEAPPVPPVPPA